MPTLPAAPPSAWRTIPLRDAPLRMLPAVPTPDTRTRPDGQILINRAEVARRTGTSIRTVEAWLRHRADTGHPDPVTRIGRSPYFDAAAVDQWYAAYRASATGLATAEQGGDPDELLTIDQAARMLGHSSSGTLKSWLYRQPGYFPDPDHTELDTRGRTRRWWRRDTLQTWAAGRDRRGGGRPAGRPQPRQAHWYQNDPALDTALGMLHAGQAPTETSLAHAAGISVPKARRVLRVARDLTVRGRC